MTGHTKKRSSRVKLENELADLRQQLALYEASEAFARAGHFVRGREEACLYHCSATCADLFGIAGGKLIGAAGWQRLLRRIHPDQREAFAAVFACPEDSATPATEFRIVHDDGSLRHLVRVEARKLSDGKTIAGLVRKISARLDTESGLGDRDSMVLQVERIADIGYFVFDEVDDRYLYASPGCARIYGLGEAEYGQSFDSHEQDLQDVHRLDRDRVRQAYAEYFNRGGECRIEFRIHRADGEVRWVRELLVAIEMQPDGRVASSRGVIQDITGQKLIELELRASKQNLEKLVEKRTGELAETVVQLQQEIEQRQEIAAELEFLANHDPLTGLPSLRLAKDRLEHALAVARRERQMVGLMFVDLDGFKEINDEFGHDCGDAVLRATAERLKAGIRETDTVARIGGDEFLVVLCAIPDLGIVERIAESMIERVSQEILLERNEVRISASIGIALFPNDAADAKGLMRVADKTMYFIKRGGKNSFGFSSSVKVN